MTVENENLFANLTDAHDLTNVNDKHENSKFQRNPLDTTVTCLLEPQKASAPNVSEDHLQMLNETIVAGFTGFTLQLNSSTRRRKMYTSLTTLLLKRRKKNLKKKTARQNKIVGDPSSTQNEKNTTELNLRECI